jgi:importin-5
LEEKLLT